MIYDIIRPLGSNGNVVEPNVKDALNNISKFKKANYRYDLVPFNNLVARLNGNVVKPKVKEALNNVVKFLTGKLPL